MLNNIIKTQLASPASMSMKIESKQKNVIPQGEQSFGKLLNEQINWNEEQNKSLQLSNYFDNNTKVWLESKQSIMTEANPYGHFINAASERFNVPVSLIEAVIKAESSFNTHATSSAGAKGLMQLMDGTAKGLGVTNSYDPEQNINGGTKYLSMLLKRYDGQLQVALAAYNAGPTRIDKLGVKSNEDLYELKGLLPEETQGYIEKVMSYLT